MRSPLRWLRDAPTSSPAAIERRSGGTWTLENGWPVWLSGGRDTDSNEVVTASTALAVTAVWRCVSLIAGTIASLPLKTYRDVDGTRERVRSWVDNPGGVGGPTPYQWKETLVAHLLLHGNAYGFHLETAAGTIAGQQLIPPELVRVERDDTVPGGVVYIVRVIEGGRSVERRYTTLDLTHYRRLSVDGVRGLSPIAAARRAIGNAISGDRAAGRMFRNGAMLSGLVTVDDDLEEDQASELSSNLNAQLGGMENAGAIRVMNAGMKFTPWSMSAEDAQFLESRGYGVEEVSRLYGVPKVLLSQDGASTWGAGIAELVRGMQRFTFAPYTSCVEEALSLTLAAPRFCEFDYRGLLQPSPAEEIELIARQVEAGLLTVDEARQLLGRAPNPALVEAPADA